MKQIQKQLDELEELYKDSWNENIGKYFFEWEGIIHEFDTEFDMDNWICQNILKIKKEL